MRSTFRSLAAGLLSLVAAAAIAQQPYTWTLSGTVSNCYSGQTITVQINDGTNQNSLITASVPVNTNSCTFSQSFGVPVAYITMIMTTQCNGMVQTYADSATFNFVLDSAFTNLSINCGGGQVYDCAGVLNGPAMPGTPCDDNNPSTFNDTWSSGCSCYGDSINGTWDCLQIWNGPNMPGTACNDNNFGTVNDTWTSACLCVGQDTTNNGTWDCLQIWNGPNMPGTACNDNNFGTVNDTWTSACLCVGQDTVGGTWDCLQVWNGPAMPGTLCVNFLGDTGVWSVQCQCQTNTNVYDCTGVLNGPNMPGTSCDDNNPLTVQDHWNANCMCVGTVSNVYDCLGIQNGPNIPGSACTGVGNDSTTFTGTWDYQCVCHPDTNLFQYDCLGVLNGNAMPGTSCTIPGTIEQGIWSSNCVCSPIAPCQANFWVLQAYTDSTNGNDPQPLLNEVWVWNLSSGGSGTYTFLWSYGDGGTSNDPFPTHIYAGNGPYNLCLTIADGNGCTSTYCDSVSVNDDGIFTGVVGEIERSSGFTISVRNQASTGIAEQQPISGISAWPNPAVDELNIALVSSLSGAVDVTVTDLNGRTVIAERNTLVNGKNQFRLNTSGLDAGIYLLRIGNTTSTTGQRFVKTH